MPVMTELRALKLALGGSTDWQTRRRSHFCSAIDETSTMSGPMRMNGAIVALSAIDFCPTFRAVGKC